MKSQEENGQMHKMKLMHMERILYLNYDLMKSQTHRNLRRRDAIIRIIN